MHRCIKCIFYTHNITSLYTSYYNLFLSNKRSSKVKEKLILDGIRDERLETRSFGEDNPDYANDPISERRKNRRVIISVNRNP